MTTITPLEATNNFKLDKDRVTVRFDGSVVTIIRRRGLLRSPVESRIPISRISMVSFNSGLVNGFIEFVAAGVDGRVKFPNYKRAEFEALKAAVEEALQ